MDTLLFTIASFVVALAILIAVHEFGHFWVARRLGVRVLRFSIGFGQPLWKRVSPRDGTEYVIAAVPLGGYVKMLDEREASVAESDLPRAFNRQPLWRRTAIVVAGPLFNFAFAILAYWLVFVSGDTGLRPLVGEVAPESIAEQAGIRPGDELLEVGERPTATWEAAVYALVAEHLEGTDLALRVRDGDGAERVAYLDAEALAGLSDDPNILQTLGLSPARPVLPAVIGELVRGEAADRAGLRPGDRLLSADGRPLDHWQHWVEYVRARPDTPIEVEVERGTGRLLLEVVPKALQQQDQVIGRIGASADVPEGLYDDFRTEVKLGPVMALGASLEKTADLSLLMLKVLGRMVTGQASIENLSGPISIAESAGKSASYGLTYFVKFLAIVSISLGVLNLLPIPVLDGGHLLFFLIEGVTGRPLSERAQLQGQRIGLALLLALMGLAFYVDLSRLLG
jgi:regulator of sigma E protease